MADLLSAHSDLISKILTGVEGHWAIIWLNGSPVETGTGGLDKALGRLKPDACVVVIRLRSVGFGVFVGMIEGKVFGPLKKYFRDHTCLKINQALEFNEALLFPPNEEKKVIVTLPTTLDAHPALTAALFDMAQEDKSIIGWLLIGCSEENKLTLLDKGPRVPHFTQALVAAPANIPCMLYIRVTSQEYSAGIWKGTHGYLLIMVKTATIPWVATHKAGIEGIFKPWKIIECDNINSIITADAAATNPAGNLDHAASPANEVHTWPPAADAQTKKLQSEAFNTAYITDHVYSVFSDENPKGMEMMVKTIECFLRGEPNKDLISFEQTPVVYFRGPDQVDGKEIHSPRVFGLSLRNADKTTSLWFFESFPSHPNLSEMNKIIKTKFETHYSRLFIKGEAPLRSDWLSFTARWTPPTAAVATAAAPTNP